MDIKQSRVPEKAVVGFLEKLETERCRLHGFAMLDRGKMLAEGYWAPFTASSLHRMYSAGKSFVSLAIGLLQEEGKLSLDHDICRYFPDKCPEEGVCHGGDASRGCSPWLAQMTIRQMLTMTTCHRKTTYKQYKGDWVESFFRVEPTNLPGAIFSYDTSATHVLSALAERLSGKKLMDYLREKCFDKIGVSQEAYFLPDPAGVSQGGSGLNCTLRDLLAVAELVMNGGIYRGERLLPEGYIREATACQVPTFHQPAYDEQFGYGYQIWRGRHDSFYFYGIGGQMAVCLPKEQFILVTMGDTLDNKNGIKDIFDAFFEMIYPWLEGVQPHGESEDEGMEKAGEESVEGEESAERKESAKKKESVGEAEWAETVRKAKRATGSGESVRGADRTEAGKEERLEFGKESQGTESGGKTLAEKLSELSLAWPYPASELAYNGRDSVLNEADAADGFVQKHLHRDLWSGKMYVFSDNMLKITMLRVDFDGIRGNLYMKKEDRDFELVFGTDTCIRQRFPWAGMNRGNFRADAYLAGKQAGAEPESAAFDESGNLSSNFLAGECCCQGYLYREDTLFLRCYLFGPDMATLTMVVHFQEAGATVKMQKGADDSLKNFEGVASGKSVFPF